MNFKNSLLSLALIGSVVSTQPGFAQEGETAAANAEVDDTDEQARLLYLRGDRLYAEGSYEEATVAFRESYELSGRAGLLFNLANAYERLGRLEEALQALQRFAPDAPEHQRGAVNTRISALEERLREQDEARRAAEDTNASDPLQAAVVDEEAPPSSSVAKPIGIILLTVGVAAAGGGLAAALLARSSRSNLDDACIGTLCPTSVSDDVDAEKRRALAADILLFGGGALVVGGVIALIIGRSSSDDDQARIDVSPTLGGASATLSGRF